MPALSAQACSLTNSGLAMQSFELFSICHDSAHEQSSMVPEELVVHWHDSNLIKELIACLI